jgi:hypothetical protein
MWTESLSISASPISPTLKHAGKSIGSVVTPLSPPHAVAGGVPGAGDVGDEHPLKREYLGTGVARIVSPVPA